jgi:DNA end-binding protein Ku
MGPVLEEMNGGAGLKPRTALPFRGGPMRTIWNGSISFGLVNIPVGLALATTPKEMQSYVSFRSLHRECKTQISQKRWCPSHERVVGPDEIV